MSMDFEGDDTQYLDITQTLQTAFPVTFFAWVKFNSLLSDSWHVIFEYTDGADAIRGTLGGTSTVSTSCVHTANYSATTTGVPSIDTWYPMLFIVKSDGKARVIALSEDVIHNGTQTWDGSAPYNLVIGSRDTYFDKTPDIKLAWFTAWSSELGASDITALQAGTDPSTIATGSILACWPLTTNDANLLVDTASGSSYTLTNNGTTPYSSDNPPILSADVEVIDVDTDETIVNGQLNVVITGTGFGAIQGTGSVVLVNGAITATCTIVSWADTLIVFNVVQGNVPFTTASNAVFVKVTNDSASTDSLLVTFNPEDDTAVIELLNPTEGDGQVDITGTPATADLYHHDDILYLEDGTTPTAYTVSIDATGKYTFSESPVDGTYKFKVRHWSAGWDVDFLSLGAVQTVIIATAPSVPSPRSGPVPSLPFDITLMAAVEASLEP